MLRFVVPLLSKVAGARRLRWLLRAGWLDFSDVASVDGSKASSASPAAPLSNSIPMSVTAPCSGARARLRGLGGDRRCSDAPAAGQSRRAESRPNDAADRPFLAGKHPPLLCGGLRARSSTLDTLTVPRVSQSVMPNAWFIARYSYSPGCQEVRGSASAIRIVESSRLLVLDAAAKWA